MAGRLIDYLQRDRGFRGGTGWRVRLLKRLFVDHGQRSCLAWLRLGQYWRDRRFFRRAHWCETALQRRFGCYISMDAEIGDRLKLPHPIGIVIGRNVRIGADCTIYQQVTLGALRLGDWKSGAYPVLGDGVTCFAGAKIVGALSIGAGAVIGANAVVLKDVPAECSAVGVPARVLPGKAGIATPPDRAPGG